MVQDFITIIEKKRFELNKKLTRYKDCFISCNKDPDLENQKLIRSALFNKIKIYDRKVKILDNWLTKTKG